MSFELPAAHAAPAQTRQEPGGSRVRRLAVIGAGTEGVALASRAASAGYLVTLEDLLPGRRRAAALQLDGIAAPGLISYAASVEEACRKADLVVDFVPDELESKLEIFSLLDRMAPPHTIFATPTRTLSIADLASCTYRQERCVALRFSPAAFTAERFGVEIVQAPQSASCSIAAMTAETTAVMAAFWRSLGAEVTFAVDRAPLP